MLFINNNNGSTHLGNCIQKTFGFFPSKTWIGNRFSVNMITSDLLISTFDVTFDHHTFYQCFDVWIQVAAVKHFVHDTNLFCILFIGVGVVCIDDTGRILQITLVVEV